MTATKAERLRKVLNKLDLAHEFEIHPNKIKCNNCGTVLKSKIPTPMTLLDSLSTRTLYCNVCGPVGADVDDLDWVEIVEHGDDLE